MRILVFCLSLLVSASAFAQNDEQEQINKDVWFNFMQAYQGLDASLFNQIHTDDVLRVLPEKQKMYVGRDYKDKNLEVFNQWNAKSLKQKIEFSFISRTQQGDWAYEVGIYKLTRKKGLRSESYFGKFHVTLQKVNGIWKIKIDADSSEGGTISEVDFETGVVLAF